MPKSLTELEPGFCLVLCPQASQHLWAQPNQQTVDCSASVYFYLSLEFSKQGCVKEPQAWVGTYPSLQEQMVENSFCTCSLTNVCTCSCISSKNCHQCYIPSSSEHQGPPVFPKHLVIFKQPNWLRLIANIRYMLLKSDPMRGTFLMSAFLESLENSSHSNLSQSLWH